MDTFDAVKSKLEVREYDSNKKVSHDLKLKVLDAARMTGSGSNTQHWRFLLVQNRDAMRKLAEDSTSGQWVADSDFAVVVLTDPKYPFHQIDTGRAAQDMELTAWNYGVGSGVYTGIKPDALRRDFGIPGELEPTIVVGFGYPTRKVSGKRKQRRPLEDVAFLDRFGNRFGNRLKA